MRYYRGPYLYLYNRRGRTAKWFIRDGTKMTGTDCVEEDKESAEAALANYAARTGRSVAQPKWARAPSNRSPMGTIYFVSCDIPDYPVKIGIAFGELDVRLRALQLGSPYRLVVLAAMPGTAQGETDLHRKFKRDRLESEWFARSAEIMEIVVRLQHKREMAA